MGTILANLPYKIIIPLILGMLLGGFLVYKLTPKAKSETITKVETVKEIQYVDRVKVVTRDIKKPDGTIIHETENSTDKSVISSTKDTQTIVQIKPFPYKYRADGFLSYDARKRQYSKGVALERIFEPGAIGITIHDNGAIGLMIGINF